MSRAKASILSINDSPIDDQRISRNSSIEPSAYAGLEASPDQGPHSSPTIHPKPFFYRWLHQWKNQNQVVTK